MAKSEKPKIAVLGLGFVGLTTALGFADKGYQVQGFDAASQRMKAVRALKIDFHEPHLGEALRRHTGKGFSLAATFDEAVTAAAAIFFCVGTPTLRGGGADLRQLTRAVTDAAKAAGRGSSKIFIIKSTVPPGTVAKKLEALLRKGDFRSGKEIRLVSNPEFLREGFAWEDFTKPDRIVLGADDERTLDEAAKLYKGFGAPIVRVNPTTAEFIKCSSNTFLATIISFANECAAVADAIGGIDLRRAFAALHQDRRWLGEPARMATYFYPGCGFGGYCLPKDSSAFVHVARAHGIRASVAAGAVRVNSEIKRHTAEAIIGASKKGSRIGVLGLAFKPGTDDVRDAPSADIIRHLLQAGRKVIAYDPLANESFQRQYQLPIAYGADVAEVSRQADAVAVLVACPEFKKQKSLFADKLILDGRHYL